VFITAYGWLGKAEVISNISKCRHIKALIWAWHVKGFEHGLLGEQINSGKKGNIRENQANLRDETGPGKKGAKQDNMDSKITERRA
jgi:hypothetical protein